MSVRSKGVSPRLGQGRWSRATVQRSGDEEGAATAHGESAARTETALSEHRESAHVQEQGDTQGGLNVR